MCLLSHPYPSDLSDQEWEILAPLIPPAKPGGRRRKWPMRRILNATFYLLRSGCQWRMLPREFPPWSTPYIITSDYGLWTAPGRRLTRCCAKGYAYAEEVVIRNRALASSTPRVGKGHQCRRGAWI